MLRDGTALRVLLMGKQGQTPSAVNWDRKITVDVFTKHKWIEPGETVVDEVVLDLGTKSKEPALVEAHLLWKWRRNSNISVYAKSDMR